MAEALAVVGIVANIVQLVDFSSKVLNRLNEFQSSVDEVPNSFRNVKVELPLLLDTLKHINKDISAGLIADEIQKSLLPVIEACQTQIESLDVVLVKTLPAPGDSRTQRTRKAFSSLSQEAKVEKVGSTLRSHLLTLTFYYSVASSTLQPLKDEKLVKIRQWLSAPDPSLNYQKALKQRQADTGLWFLKSEQYAKWKTDAASFLWLHGIPGCGKTILTSTIIQSVLQYCDRDPGKVVAYFYFDFNDPQKRVPELMVKSLITQLSQQCTRIPTALEALFSSCGNGQRQPSLDALLQALEQTIQEFPRSFIILDALDECADRAELMEILETMAGWKLENLHIMVASRKERDLESSLECLVEEHNTICLQSKVVDKDISTYVHHRLCDDKKLRKWYNNTEMRQEIEAALMEGAHGMFRWAVCQLDTLSKCLTRSMLRKALAELPPTLDETYDRILCAIDNDHSTYALRILQWLAFSARPLLIEEVAEVVAIDTERDPAFDKEQVLEDPLDALTICASLLSVSNEEDPSSDEEDSSLEEEEDSSLKEMEKASKPTRRVVALAHYSVKEYLISGRIQGRAVLYSLQCTTSNAFIAKCCLGYLLQFQRTDNFCNETIVMYKLARYSAQFWIVHSQAAKQKEEEMNRLIMKLFSLQDGTYFNWTRIYNLENPRNGPNVGRNLEDVPTPLYNASMAGLTEIVGRLINEVSADVNAQGGGYRNALQAASVEGHDKVVELLLDKGADVNAKGGHYGNALQASSVEGHDKVVELLLEKGADVNAQGGKYGSALYAASVEGHDKVVELLLEKGADVNAQGGVFGNALQAASVEGHDKVVELLLDKGADVNAKGGHYGIALQAASVEGHDKVVELLLEKGADVNAKGGVFGNALRAASAGGHCKVVELLLDNGADVNAKGGGFGNALQAASVEGHDKVVKLLLDEGADVNT